MALVPLTPFFLFFYFTYLYQKRINRLVKEYKDRYSCFIVENNISWVKNFDLWGVKKKFYFDFFKPNYNFNLCDLIMGKNSIMIVGKSCFLVKNIQLYPIIIANCQSVNYLGNTVKFKNVYINRNDIEIEYEDFKYKNTMTLVLKNSNEELFNEIKKRFASTIS